MKQISGYVLAQGSNAGIANLIVNAHDTRDMPEAASEARNGTVEALALRLGRRIGSVLTDTQGHFTLGVEDLQFAGNESRPDLMVTVSAPEDVQSTENPVPLSPQKRILYISAVARRDAGAEEAFLIRLLPSQLEQFGIATTGSTSTKESNQIAGRTADTLMGGWEASDLFRERFQPRIMKQVKAGERRRQAAKEATKNLSGIPLYLRGVDNPLRNNSLLIPNREGLTELPTVQKKAIAQGLTRLQNRTTPATLRLYLTRAEIKELGLTIDAQGIVKGKANAKAVTAKMYDGMRGFDLIRTRGSSDIDLTSLEKRYLQTSPRALVAAMKRPNDPVVSASLKRSQAAPISRVRAKPRKE